MFNGLLQPSGHGQRNFGLEDWIYSKVNTILQSHCEFLCNWKRLHKMLPQVHTLASKIYVTRMIATMRREIVCFVFLVAESLTMTLVHGRDYGNGLFQGLQLNF